LNEQKNGVIVISLKNIEIKNKLEQMHENFISDFILFENTLVTCGHNETEIKIWDIKSLTLGKTLSV